MLLKILTLLGSLALFVYGMELMSAGIQKILGRKLGSMAAWLKSGSPLKQALSGAGVTVAIQSSSATTLLVAGLVGSSAISLHQGICGIIGANVGTTLAPWVIASLAYGSGFRPLAFILLGLGFILSFLKGRNLKSFGEALLGFSLVLLAALFLQSSALGLLPEGSGALPVEGKTVVLSLLAGIFLAFALHSSGGTVMLTMLLSSSFWLPLPLAGAAVIGANVGKTISANIAARRADAQARRIALAHTVFNLSGAAVALAFLNPFCRLGEALVSPLGLGPQMSLMLTVACLHSAFNLLWAAAVIWLRKPFAGLLQKLIPDGGGSGEGFKLVYIGDSRSIGTPSISIALAFKETLRFAQAAREGFGNVKLALNEKDSARFEACREALVKTEELTDRYEAEIATYLNKAATGPLNEEESRQVKTLYRIIGELESVGDSCENVSRLLGRLHIHGLEFSETLLGKLNLLTAKVSEALSVMVYNLRLASEGKAVQNISNAFNAEDNINTCRNTLRNEGLLQSEKNPHNYLTINYYLDLLEELEAVGDFLINISQSLAGDFGREKA